MSNEHEPNRCPDCGGVCLPPVDKETFEQARRLAEGVWCASKLDASPVSVACVTAALLMKRAAVAEGLPAEHVEHLAALYIDIVSVIIRARREAAMQMREAAAVTGDEPKDMN